MVMDDSLLYRLCHGFNIKNIIMIQILDTVKKGNVLHGTEEFTMYKTSKYLT